MEEGSVLRGQSSETTNSLSVSGSSPPHPWGSFPAVAVGFSRHSGSRASLSRLVRRCVLRAPSLTADPRPSRIIRKSYGPRVPDRTMDAARAPFCFAGFGTDRLRCQLWMKSAGRVTPNRWARLSSHAAYGAVGQNTSYLSKGAAKQEKFQPRGRCFFLTSTFIELTGHELQVVALLTPIYWTHEG
jgi:hypothetical protein